MKFCLPVVREVVQKGRFIVDASNEAEAEDLFNNGGASDFVEDDFDVKNEEQGHIYCED